MHVMSETTVDRSLPLRERKAANPASPGRERLAAIFAEQGFDATTIDELADEAEVSKTTFFRFFPAKEAGPA